MKKKNKVGCNSRAATAPVLVETDPSSSRPESACKLPEAMGPFPCHCESLDEAPQSASPSSQSRIGTSTELQEERMPSCPAESPIQAPAQRRMPPPSAQDFSPQRFGSYDLVWEIRRDALSKTYAATRDGISNLLAVRVFNARLTDSAQVRSIQGAAAKATELTHINHVSVYESGVSETGAPYVVTDLVEGETVAEVLQVVKRLDIARFLNIFSQVCDTLIEVHSKQLVHGNLSPEKIILASSDTEADIVKLVDLGMPADPVQCAFYLAPEQAIDRSKVDPRTDIYSLGCIMYEAIVGTPPLVHHNLSQAGLNCLHELASHYSPQSPEHKALKLLDCIVIKCMQKERSKRFRSVRELMDALKLVNDCICGGSARKLPPKADKLLLFRFLDMFDKKIVACLSAYILLSGFIFKCVSEIQIQKDIDDAQVCAMNDGRAQEYWKAALQHAQQNGSAPKLLAELHWALADTLVQQPTGGSIVSSTDDSIASCPDGSVVSDKLRLEAIGHYEQALAYYGRGAHYRTNALGLLDNINNQWMSMEDREGAASRRATTLKTAQKLFRERNFAGCADVCVRYLHSSSDQQITWYAARSYNELGLALPPAKSIRMLEKSLYYADKAAENVDAAYFNLKLAISKCGMMPESPSTALYLAESALKDGDADAARSELLSFHFSGNAQPLQNLLQSYDNIREYLYVADWHDSKSTVGAIPSLERTLKLQAQVFGVHSNQLEATLSKLAKCYRISGDTEKALATYKRLLAMAPTHSSTDWSDTFVLGTTHPALYTLAYADLLARKGKKDLATRTLEDAVYMKSGALDTSNPLCIRLLAAYADNNQKEQLKYILSLIAPDIPPDRLNQVAYTAQSGDVFSSSNAGN
jgi:tetratricopeptide (TPR) repeat protein